MASIPTYALYGETQAELFEQRVHCESIPARSALFGWEIGLHRHDHFFQILNMSAGHGLLLGTDDPRALRASMLVTMPPRAPHGFRFSKDVQGHVVTLAGERVEAMLKPLPEIRSVLARPHVLDLAAPHAAWLRTRIEAHVAALAEECAGRTPERFALVEAHLTVLLIEIGRLLRAIAAERSAPEGPLGRQAVKFQSLIDRHFRHERLLSFYAERLAVSETHLNRISRAAFDRSALGLIHHRLMVEAARDLTFTLIPVKQIAFSLGFDDPAYFSRFFTRQMGLSPSQFRAVQARRSGSDGARRKS